MNFKQLSLVLLFATATTSGCLAQQGAIFAPRYMGEPCTHEGTNLLKDRDGSIQFTFRKGSNAWHGGEGFSGEVYQIFTSDGGRTWSDTTMLLKTSTGSSYFATISPASGEMVLFYQTDKGAYRYIRTDKGRTDATWDRELAKERLVAVGYSHCEWADLPSGGKRLIAGAHADNEGIVCFLSDDDGRTFSRSAAVKVANETPHIWQTGCVEPAILQLKDGRIWMLMRTSNDRLWECFSSDFGQTWTEPVPSRFKAGNNSSVSVRRLNNGDIAVFWNNTQITPPSVTDDQWSFTNRDIFSVAISSDEGLTWRGFREVWRDNLRNGEFVNYPGDKGLNETKMEQAADGSIIIAAGQAPEHRSFIQLDPRWVDLKSHSDNFYAGLDGWCTNTLVRRSPAYSALTHYAYNRKPGATLVPHPSIKGQNVMKIAKTDDTTLYSSRQGAVWNFPAAMDGELKLRVMFNRGFGGALIALNDVWAQPTIDIASPYQLYIPPTLEYSNEKFEIGKWYDFKLVWNADQLTISVDGKAVKKIEKKYEYVNGLCYLRLRNEAVNADREGFYVEKVEMSTL